MERTRFLNPELFTDLPLGARRQVDLAAEVQTRSGEPEQVVVHVEIEAQARRVMESRILEYATLLRGQRGSPVVPIVVFVRGGPKDGVSRCTERDRVAGRTVMAVEYSAFSHSRSRAEAYIRRPERLAWALAALMSTTWSPAEHRLRCMEAIAHGEMSEFQRFLLYNCVGTYIQLEGDEKMRYEDMTQRERTGEVANMERTWAEKLEQRGALEAERRLLLRLVETRFGPLPESSLRRLQTIESTERLERLFDRALQASSLADVRLED